MRISTKGTYALAALVDLACHTGEGHENLKNISSRLQVSENYLRQLFMNLTKSGIVRSVRGAQGGYSLAKDASDINVFDVLESVEENMVIVPCIDKTLASQCGNYDHCATRDTWVDLAEIVFEGTKNRTLAELVAGVEVTNED